MDLSDVLERLQHLGIRRSDVTETFVRSSGPGGQNVNKTSTCVYLKHIPTGIEVKCRVERSQVQNRYRAWELLMAKVESRKKALVEQERRRMEKLRRQKRRRPRGLQERILEGKRRQAEKKRQRAVVRWQQE